MLTAWALVSGATTLVAFALVLMAGVNLERK
jgi:hypothetical protein